MDKIINLDDAPNTKKIVDEIIKIIEYISTDEMIKMRNEDYMKFQDIMYEVEEFKDFISKYFSLFTFLIDKNIQPLDKLITMINMKALIESGKINDNAAMEYVRNMMNEEYIYKQHGGKENFERYIKKMSEEKDKKDKHEKEKKNSIKNIKSKKEIIDIVNKDN
jgi:polyhydroxyalkanoate synthesis regulator phasin